jgi:hypothetical protein
MNMYLFWCFIFHKYKFILIPNSNEIIIIIIIIIF